jgi:hypothetical protein
MKPFPLPAALACIVVILTSPPLAADVGAASGETLLIDQGKALAEIVVAEDAAPVTKLAAAQLQEHLATMTGVKLPVVAKPGEAAATTKIYVGPSPFIEKLGVETRDLEHDAYRVVSGDHWLVLAGRDVPFFVRRGPQAAELLRLAGLPPGPEHDKVWEKWYTASGGKWSLPYSQLWKDNDKELGVWCEDERGSFNAVTDFLRSLGMRWYMPGELGKVVPKRDRVALPAMVNRTVEPDFPVRFPKQHRFGQKDDGLWELWMGFSHAAEVIDATFPEHGINAVDDTRTTGSLYAHPGAQPPKPDEYYALFGDKREVIGKTTLRKTGAGKECLSSPGLFEENVRYLLACANILGAPMESVMPSDAYTAICQCDLCKGKDTPERGYTGLLSNYVWDYVDRVAREVAKRKPGMKVLGTSYGTYRHAPTNIEHFSPNLVVCITQHRCEFGQKPEEKATFLGYRKEFLSKVAPGRNLLIYDYYRGDHHTPHYSPHAIAEDLRSLKGICLGDIIDVERDKPLEPARLAVQSFDLYVTARCYWDASLDVDALIDEYCRDFYGPSAAEMKALMAFGEANWMSISKSPEKIDTTLQLLQAAQAKATPESVYGRRLALVAEYLKPLEKLRNQSKIVRTDVPEVLVDQRLQNTIVLDGKLDDPFWQKMHMTSRGKLKPLVAGTKPGPETRFLCAWANDNLYFGITCYFEKGELPQSTAAGHDDMALWKGDCIELLLEPPGHSYYQIAVSPNGVVTDQDWSLEKAKRLEWESGVEVKTSIEEDHWTVEIRIPAAGAEQEKILPLQGVAGGKPTEAFPWYFNICRQRVRGNGFELSAFSPTGKDGFHVPEKFAKLWVGRRKVEKSGAAGK